MKSKIQEEINELIGKIEKELNEIDKKLKEKNNDISIPEIENIGLGKTMLSSFITSAAITLIGEAAFSGIITKAVSATIGGAIGGPIRIGIGFAVRLIASLTSFLIHTLRKEKRYKDGLIKFKETMKEALLQNQQNILDGLNILEEDFTEKFNRTIKLIFINIANIDNEEWKDIKANYFMQKERIYKIIGIIE